MTVVSAKQLAREVQEFLRFKRAMGIPTSAPSSPSISSCALSDSTGEITARQCSMTR